MYINQCSYFVAPNPITDFNKTSVYPTIHNSSFIGPFSCIIGNVTIEENVFIASNVSIRADEGTPFYIGSGTNIQDGTIFHGLANSTINYENNNYSIYLSDNVTCAHKCVIHGPCFIGSKVFIGFNSTVFNAIIEENTYISSGAIVTGGVKINPGRFVPTGALIDTQEKADALECVSQNEIDFVEDILHCNHQYPEAYLKLFKDNALVKSPNF